MNLVSFDALRTLHFPAHTQIKASQFFARKAELENADWVLFPEYWQINALIYSFKKRIFPSQASYLIGHNKVEMTRAFQALVPEHLPLTHILANTSENADMLWQQMPLPFVAKIPKASMGKGVFLIESREDWKHYCEQSDVLYAQEYLPIDRDLRLVVIGEKVVGGYWRLQSSNGFHNNIAQGGEICHGPLPHSAVALVEKVAQKLGVDHAGFDVAMLGDYPFLFEFNRIFGNQGVEAVIGDLTPLIIEYLQRKLNEELPPTRPKKSGGGRGRRLRRAA